MKQAFDQITATLEAAPALNADVLRDGKTALVIVDMVNGFLTEGVMSSPVCADVLPAVEKLLAFAKSAAFPVAAFADCHELDCIEFRTFPPHCIRGTSEAEIAPSLCEIGGFTRIEKNSTNGFLTPEFRNFMESHPEIERFVVCGVCTDICVMQFALTLRCFCNQEDRPAEILIPVNTVATYDAPNHNAALMQTMALQMMAQAGIQIIREVQYNG